MSGLFNPDGPQAVHIIPKRAIGPLTLYVVIEEAATDKLEITQHPVERGAAITDHAFKQPSTLSIRALFKSEAGPVAEVYRKILDLQESRIPFDVVTGKRVYKNMLMVSLSESTDSQTPFVLAVSIEMQEVRLVSIETVTVPERAKQSNPSKTGKTEAGGVKQAEGVDGDAAGLSPITRAALAALVSALGG